MYYKKIGNHFFDCVSKSFCEKRDESSALHKLNSYEFNELRKRHFSRSLYLVVTITSKCNLNCAYCFENGIERTHMSESTMVELVKNIELYISNHDILDINCVLFGGEPLLNQNVLLGFCNGLQDICTKHHLTYSSMLCTNGLICEDSLLKQLYELGVNSVQITLDGSETINNIRRVSKTDTTNVYNTILCNLPVFSDIFDEVFIKYNIDDVTYGDYENFLKDLNNTHCDNYTIILEAIQSTPHYKHAIPNSNLSLASIFVKMIGVTIENNQKYISKIFTTPCMHSGINSYMIDTDSTAYSCISSYGLDEFKMGSFSSDIYGDSLKFRNSFNIDALVDECNSCEYLPICWGGCRYECYNRNLSINCRREFYDAVLFLFYKDIFQKYGVKQIE